MITVDLYEKDMIKNKTYLIKNGVPQNNYAISTKPVTFDDLYEMYQNFKNSIPNNKKYRYEYFKAKSPDMLTIQDIQKGVNRQKAKEILETAILTGILNKSLVWPDPNKWFWQSEKDKDFILLRDWFL